MPSPIGSVGPEVLPLAPSVSAAVDALAAAHGVSAEAALAALFVVVASGGEDAVIVDGAVAPSLDGHTFVSMARQLASDRVPGRLESSGLVLDTGAQELHAVDRPAALVALMAERIATLATAVRTTPEEFVVRLPCLGDAELAEIEERGTGPAAPIPTGNASDDVRRHARERPNAAALGDEERVLTYAELDAAVDRLTSALQARAVADGDRVAVVMGRGAGVVIAMLAVYRAGAIYVPIDPSYPSDRMTFIASDSGARLVLHDDLGGTRLGTIDLPRLHVREGLSRATAEKPKVAQCDVAYIIYTSGSTGTPKGVEVGHRAYRNTIAAKVALLTVQPHDRFLAVMSTAFDASIFEFCMPLMAGSRLHVASSTIIADFESLARAIDDLDVTVMGATPPTWRGLLATAWKPRRRLRIMVGGEALPSDLAIRLARHFRVFDMYGLTETAITSTSYEVDGRPLGPTCPVGTPLPNMLARVRDSYGRPTPLGGIGELYVGGVGIARGYRGRDELTRQRFVQDPAGHSSLPFFRTGDRVHLRLDGLLEFLGRFDTQVKIRGARVELGEIEARLEELTNVSAAAVLCEGDVGDERLLAFVVRSGEAAPEHLRRALRRVLPEHAVPSVFVFCEALPLTANGKIDRRALAALPRAAVAPLAVASSLASTSDGVQRAVEEEVRSLAGGTPIDPAASLSDLGIDSVGRTRLKKALAARGITVAYVDLLGDATVTSVGAHARTEHVSTEPVTTGARSNVPQRALDNHRLPLMVHLANPGRGAWNCQIACRLRGPLQLELLEGAWNVLVARHDALRLQLPWRGFAHPQASFADHVTVAVRHVCLPARGARLADARVALQQEELHSQFDLEQAPLFRVALAQVGDGVHELVWTYFSALFDGWSSAIVLRELFVIYDALRRGASHGLPDAPSFFAHLTRYNARAWDAGSAFFARELEGYSVPPPLAGAPGGSDEERDVQRLAPDVRDLFVAMNERPFWVERPAELSRPFPSLLQERVVEAAQRARVGTATLLLAAWGAVLMREYERPDVLVGMVAANRPNFETAVGKYTSLMPFRVRMQGSALTRRDWLRAVEQHVARVHEHEGTPVRAWVRNVVSEPWQMAIESTFTFVNYASKKDAAASTLGVTEVRQVEGGIPPVFGMVVIPGAPGTMRLEMNQRCQIDPARAERMLASFAEIVEALSSEDLNELAESLLEGSYGGARFGVPIGLL